LVALRSKLSVSLCVFRAPLHGYVQSDSSLCPARCNWSAPHLSPIMYSYSITVRDDHVHVLCFQVSFMFSCSSVFHVFRLFFMLRLCVLCFKLHVSCSRQQFPQSLHPLAAAGAGSSMLAPAQT
jgi:hypothetical protein